MKMIDVLLEEMDQEASSTARVLERVPQAQLSWRPYPKSFSLGQLALHDSLAKARRLLGAMGDERLTATWRLMSGGKEIMAMPRAAVIRTIMLNHWYHHRGQLLVYLRMHDVPLPMVYGPSADENPFAAAVTAQ